MKNDATGDDEARGGSAPRVNDVPARAEGAEIAALRAAFDEFLHAAVHDMRGPLGQVRALALLLERQHKGALDADGQEVCGFIETASKRAVEVVDAIHVYANVFKAPQFEMADMNAIMDAACYTLQAVVDENRAIITRADLPKIRGDRSKLLLLVQELLGNALKFRGEAPPRIHCSAERQGPSVLFSLADNGIGVIENASELVFKPLKRLHGHEIEGTGMGLAICRRIVELHGGRIWFESRSEGGADFRFTLPAFQPE